MEIIFCGRKKFTDYAKRYGWLSGSRSDHISVNGYQDVHVDFIDCPFKDWENHKVSHMEVIRKHKPLIACAPDIYSWKEYEEKLEYAYRILELGITTIVIPKVKGMAKVIPPEFVIGWPVGNDVYSDVALSEWELFSVLGRRIHLLGSTPSKQIKLIAYHNVVSLDGNAFVKVAQKYRKAYGSNLENIDMSGDIHSDEIVFRSIDGIAEYWRKQNVNKLPVFSS